MLYASAAEWETSPEEAPPAECPDTWKVPVTLPNGQACPIPYTAGGRERMTSPTTSTRAPEWSTTCPEAPSSTPKSKGWKSPSRWPWHCTATRESATKTGSLAHWASVPPNSTTVYWQAAPTGMPRATCPTSCSHSSNGISSPVMPSTGHAVACGTATTVRPDCLPYRPPSWNCFRTRTSPTCASDTIPASSSPWGAPSIRPSSDICAANTERSMSCSPFP